MRRAVPIETVREYLEQQLAESEPLHAQNRIEWGDTMPVGTVPRDLTQDAVPVFWWS